MPGLPAFSRFRFAREGLVSANGKLPQGWSNENADEISVDSIDMGPDGPGLTLTIRFSEANAAPFISVVIGDYAPIAQDDVFAARMDAEISAARNVSGGFLILREWIAGGTYVGQATSAIPTDQGFTAVAAARSGSGESRMLQPVISIKRAGEGAGSATVRLRRFAFASLHEHPAWLTDAR